MSERDELAELLAVTEYPSLEPEWKDRADRSPVKYYSRKTADALLAAGYRKPRTITTAEEVAGLATGTVILSDQGGVWIAYDHLGWREPGSAHVSDDYDIALPAIVLWEPQP